jgi:hypothetical protein
MLTFKSCWPSLPEQIANPPGQPRLLRASPQAVTSGDTKRVFRQKIGLESGAPFNESYLAL